ncbi:MAG: caspase family protein, partial [Bacteroidota bacterium]
FKIKATEQNGFGLDPIIVNISTKKFNAPMLEIVDYKFSSEKGGTAKKGEKITLEANLQNTGYGDAKEVEVKFLYPNGVYSIADSKFNIPLLKSGQHQTIMFEFLTNKEYSDSIIPIKIELSETWKKYAKTKDVKVSVNQDLSKLTANFYGDVSVNTNIKTALLSSDVDINIPYIPTPNPNKFAIVIGNEDYSSRQSNLSSESNVQFAVSDAKVFKDYLIKTLGYEDKNVFLLTDATASEIRQKLNTIVEIFKRINPSESEVVFYYAGHGFPDEVTKTPYLIPVDVSVSNLASAIKLTEVTEELAKTNAKRITLFLDACFTGEGRNAGLLAARTARIKPKSLVVKGNMMVFSASSSDQTALQYREQKHGMFTYFLLKKLQESKGEVKYSELFNFVKSNVAIESTRSIKPQDPEWIISPDIQDNWENWKFR